MASYMDMVTVLLCMFIVLYAISTVDSDKFEKLQASLATGFGTEAGENVDTATGIVVKPEDIGSTGDLYEATIQNSNVVLAEKEISDLKAIRDSINTGLQSQGLADAVQFQITERGLTVGLIGAETYFSGNSIVLTDKANAILSTIAPVIAGIPNEVSVEGHADPVGSSGVYPTDWELSSGRATQVVRFFVERGGVAQGRAAAVGYGSARPIAGGESSLNRRVDVVVLSKQPDSVRALIPGILAAEQGSGEAVGAVAGAEAGPAAPAPSH
ncbi:flagellar motor protein MotB [Leifsonia kafniensis]|uniref:Flagellar motor protein MotB n=2 Tax=Leifsonia kafniensis TaxID=475957 RepID=A0ABP7K300_9MICO